MLLSTVSVLVVVQGSEVLEGLMNNPVLVPTDSAAFIKVRIFTHLFPSSIMIIILEDFMDFTVTGSSILQMLHV